MANAASLPVMAPHADFIVYLETQHLRRLLATEAMTTSRKCSEFRAKSGAIRYKILSEPALRLKTVSFYDLASSSFNHGYSG
jgi:hypothetical protein